MAASFSISVDPRRHLVHVAMSGFFDSDESVRFNGEFRTAQARLRCPANRHLTLVDVSAMEIQSQDRIGEFQALLSDPRYKARRLAFVVAHSLSRLQAKRAAEGRDAGFFTSEKEALDWLFRDGEAAIPAAA